MFQIDFPEPHFLSVTVCDQANRFSNPLALPRTHRSAFFSKLGFFLNALFSTLYCATYADKSLVSLKFSKIICFDFLLKPVHTTKKQICYLSSFVSDYLKHHIHRFRFSPVQSEPRTSEHWGNLETLAKNSFCCSQVVS